MSLIGKYLKSSGYRWDYSAFLPMRQDFRGATEQDRAEFVQAARRMNLRDYEQTVYWGIVSGIVVFRDTRCRDCGRGRSLVVHHRTYEHLGSEHENLQDLIGICWHCHARKHPHLTREQRASLLKLCAGDLKRAMKIERRGAPMESTAEVIRREIGGMKL